MADLSTAVGVVLAGLIVVAVFLPAYIKLFGYAKKRLMRCPETGAITLVEVETTDLLGHANQGEPRLSVKQCRLWPERKECARGCLSRANQTWQSYGFDLRSLRPFDDHEFKRLASLQH